MRYRQFILIALCAAMVTFVANAKDKAEQAMDHQAMMATYAKLAQPGEPHKQLASLAGSWLTETKEWMDPNKPAIISTGAAEMKMLLDGRYLQQEFTGQMMGKPYTGIGTVAYDNLSKRYVMMWISTTGTGIFTMEGTASADGKTISLHGQHPEPSGGQMVHRAVWKLVDKNTQTFDMYGVHNGGKEMKMMAITYTRKQ